MDPIVRHILVPTDFSEPSEAALRYASTLAGRLGAALHLLHVVEDPLTPATWGPDFYVPLDHPDVRTKALSAAEHRLAVFRSNLDESDLRVTATAVIGRAASTIVDAAIDRGADMIIMGTHGRSGLSHLVMGSVTEHVLRGAPCPVLVVRDFAEREKVTAPLAVASVA
jgi:nucleotide-binding universal stress UspA family protein